MTKTEILKQATKENRTQLTEIESKDFLKQAGIPVIEARLATSKTEAAELAKKMGFPVALKIISPDIIHKSDSGGVKLGIDSAAQVGQAYTDILAAIKKHYPKAKIQGISVQKMAKPGVEVIIGMTKDAQFGPVLMFGLGGILVEVLKDVAFRIVPLNKRDAHEMIKEIKGYPVLEGYRGHDPADISFLEDLLLKVSDFIDKNPEIKELDLNPIFAYKNKAVAVDARVILEPAAS
jgi:acetate---CoA ligase (ADP-forming) subunit beta